MTHLVDLLEEAAGGHGWVRFAATGSDRVQLSTLWRDAECVAWKLRRTFGSGAILGVPLENTRECVTFLFGAWRAGCTVASFPQHSAGMPLADYAARLDGMCRAVGASAIVLGDDDAASLVCAAPAYDLADLMIGAPRCSLDASSGSLVQYTSGSVGRPKGVHLTLDAVGEHVLTILRFLEIGSGDASCSWLPLSHDMGLIGMLLSPIVAGAAEWGHHKLTLLAPRQFAMRPAMWLRTMAEDRSTITAVPNVALDYAVRSKRLVGEVDLSCVRACVVGAEPVPASSLARFTETFAPLGWRNEALCPAYGLAEATLAVTLGSPRVPWRTRTHDDGVCTRDVVGVGSPLGGVDVKIIGGGRGPGEIRFRSPSQLADYVGATLCLDDDGFVPTSDVGFLEDGELFVLGRHDDVIIVGGRNLYPEDVESVVDHSTVRAASIAAVPRPDGQLALLVEARLPNAGCAVLERACVDIRRSVVRGVGVAPTTVAFLARGTLPRTPSGKLRRFAARELLAPAAAGVIARVDFE